MKKVMLVIDANSGDREASAISGSPEITVDVNKNWTIAGRNKVEEHPDLDIILAGPASIIEKHKKCGDPDICEGLRVLDAPAYINMEGDVIGGGLGETSFIRGLHEVKEGSADAILSGNNTKYILKYAAMKRFIGRHTFFKAIPPLTVELPHLDDAGKTLFLDIGASDDKGIKYLPHFAMIGITYADIFMGVKEPKIGLISNGKEEEKGTESIRNANKELKNMLGAAYAGMVEPRDLFTGSLDIVLAPNGFIGNIILKSLEATAEFIYGIQKRTFENPKGGPVKRNLKRTVSYVHKKIHRQEFAELKATIQNGGYNGSIFLGLTRPVFKSHGEADLEGMMSAIENSYQFIKNGKFERFNSKLEENYDTYGLSGKHNTLP